ncbi:type II toxin-antitoxin system Phd/YefM family antitoxin [Endozoicomonas euniceicola]|uniref:Antitoxin n=1 Tax=Endozoicomonas euniceicola TaxID=1234143 RepID=A0ABY6GTP4_9GAMM|nr:type II toxin-antitoxin system Phd/YefM family antitoxin [Endozoicomonas euniceicola]UYM16137.1 type II toxin-antitoxin system Phd/YefM family antitoxin [Endozoicomonas euniceicola]
MNVISYSEARHTIIHRRDGDDAVVMSLESYNNLMENLHLMSSPNNIRHINESIAQIKAGQTEEKGLIDE